MEALKVYDFNDPVDFLNASFKASRTANPQFSLRAWANMVGLSHVAMLSMVLSRKRRLLPSLSTKIGAQFREIGKMKDAEARYFDISVLFSNASSFDEKVFY